MKINYYKTFIQTIKNSVGTKMFQEFYIDETDILNGGSVACAYYVSNILKQFNLTSVGRANVPRVIEDLQKKGWKELSLETSAYNIPIGSVLIWQPLYGETYNKDSYHIGFYMGDEIAISNNSNGYQSHDGTDFVPVRHHYTYNNTRQITHIFTWDRNSLFADWLYHYEINIPFISGVGDTYLESQGLSQQEILFWSGKSEGMQYGRLCGAACTVMVLRYFGISDTVLHDIIIKADTQITYFDTKIQSEKTVSSYTPGIGRYHSGLVQIAQNIGESKGIHITGSIHSIEANEILNIIKNILESTNNGMKTCLIASVTVGFDTSKEKKGGHLVVVTGIDYNGYDHSIVVHDPIENTKKQIPLQQFINSFSGRYIVLKKSSE